MNIKKLYSCIIAITAVVLATFFITIYISSDNKTATDNALMATSGLIILMIPSTTLFKKITIIALAVAIIVTAAATITAMFMLEYIQITAISLIIAAIAVTVATVILPAWSEEKHVVNRKNVCCTYIAQFVVTSGAMMLSIWR